MYSNYAKGFYQLKYINVDFFKNNQQLFEFTYDIIIKALSDIKKVRFSYNKSFNISLETTKDIIALVRYHVINEKNFIIIRL